MSAAMFRKVLIANRGEIACRITRTCRRLGVQTVAVYSDADAQSLHVRVADEAVHIGPSPAQESYLNIPRIIAAAQASGAEAIHPGYGFLSENEDFAEACEQAGIVFIGPPASAIRAMGSKSAAKALMQEAGVPLTPGYHGPNQDPGFLHQQADAIGYPVLIKASAGGGGKGMRRVDASADFLSALASCKREAASAFGDDHVLLESYLLQPRHIEIQVFADKHGNVVSLFERDCSVQRRHQKVLEEAPAPGMTPDRRAAMGKAACDAARAVGYVGAGTVEFIADQQGNFHFMEMNTRLQVEHPVTERITGLDLVEWQLRVAAGQPLPRSEASLRISGHAIEARIYAEDPTHNFLPSIGKLIHFKAPQASEHVRIDTGVEQGDEITAFYDPMIAKLIVWDSTREAALSRMRSALADFQVVGVKTNINFLQKLVTSPSFTEARLDTALIEREKQYLDSRADHSDEAGWFLAALAHLMRESPRSEDKSPWAAADGWRLSVPLRRTLRFQHGSATREIAAEYRGLGYQLKSDGSTLAAHGTLQQDGTLLATIGDVQRKATAVQLGAETWIFSDGQAWQGKWLDPLSRADQTSDAEGSLHSPMPGIVRAVLVQQGDRVAKGTPLLVLEAMKMEYSIEAPADGRVDALLYSAGDQVPEGAQLLSFTADPTAKETSS
jgi:3-methylcrotonyl-CoA carboxylase alpha subunit